jgi:hypothetical protein
LEEAHEDSRFHDHRHGSDANRQRRVIQQRRKGETPERMKGVVASHLDRFAFRELPSPFNWSAREG